MSRRVITASLTYSSSTNRNSALTRIQSALAAYVYSDFTTTLGTGVVSSGTTGIIVSIVCDDRDDGFALSSDIYSAATQSNRQTSGFLSVNRV